MAIVSVKNTKQMRKAIEDYLQDACEFTAEEAGELIRKMIIDNIEEWYDTYTPTEYERTKELIDAIQVSAIIKTKYRYYVDIYLDVDLLSSHHKIVTTEYKNAFPYLIEEGWSMPWVDGWHREGTHAFQNMMETIKTPEFYNKISDFLKKHGYDVKWK